MQHNTRLKMYQTLNCSLSQRRNIRVIITRNSMVWNREHSRSPSAEDSGLVQFPPQQVKEKPSFQRIIIMTLWPLTCLVLSLSLGISAIPSNPNNEEVFSTKRQWILWCLRLKRGHRVLCLEVSSQSSRPENSEGWSMTTQISFLKISKRTMLMSLRRIRILFPINS